MRTVDEEFPSSDMVLSLRSSPKQRFINVNMSLVLLGEALDISTRTKLPFSNPNLYPTFPNLSSTNIEVRAGSRIEGGR
jgi:hypothetical protein